MIEQSPWPITAFLPYGAGFSTSTMVNHCMGRFHTATVDICLETIPILHETNKLRNPRPTTYLKKKAKNGQHRTSKYFFPPNFHALGCSLGIRRSYKIFSVISFFFFSEFSWVELWRWVMMAFVGFHTPANIYSWK